MITGELKSNIDKIWIDMFSYGMSNPLVVIEQLTYLFFIKSLDDMEMDNEKAAALFGTDFTRIFPADATGQEMRWSVFQNRKAEDIHAILRDEVFCSAPPPPKVRPESVGKQFLRFFYAARCLRRY